MGVSLVLLMTEVASIREPLHLNQKIQMELLRIITCEIRVYRGFRKLPNRRSADYRRNPLYT